MPKFLLFNKNRTGFTLIELLVVIVIISILATLLLANFVGVRQRGRDGQRKSDIRQLQTALEVYRADNGQYPANANAIYTSNCTASGVGPAFTYTNGGTTITYMQKLPCDPLTHGNYTYSTPDGGVTYSLYACIENANDPNIDSSTQNTCSAAGYKSFTVTNP